MMMPQPPRPASPDFSDYDPQACYDTLIDEQQPVETRMQALLAILKGNSVDALMALLPLFKKQQGIRLDIRQALAVAFGEWGSESATEALLACYADESEPRSLRLVALQALAKTQHAKALDCILSALHHEDNDFFGTAADALEHFAHDIMPELCVVLRQGKTDAQCVAAWHLGKLANNRALDALVDVASQPGTHEDVLALCAWALGEIGEARPGVLMVLKSLSTHEQEAVAQRARNAHIKVSRNLN
jgi:HEAT repeat protein